MATAERKAQVPDAARVPRGIEVLVKKASVDPEFERLLLEQRAQAAHVIGLRLEPSEVAMINSVPASQLEAIIAGTQVEKESRAVFLGRAAAAMLAVLGVAASTDCEKTKGIQPDRPQGRKPKRSATYGVRTDRPAEKK